MTFSSRSLLAVLQLCLCLLLMCGFSGCHVDAFTNRISLSNRNGLVPRNLIELANTENPLKDAAGSGVLDPSADADDNPMIAPTAGHAPKNPSENTSELDQAKPEEKGEFKLFGFDPFSHKESKADSNKDSRRSGSEEGKILSILPSMSKLISATSRSESATTTASV